MVVLLHVSTLLLLGHMVLLLRWLLLLLLRLMQVMLGWLILAHRRWQLALSRGCWHWCGHRWHWTLFKWRIVRVLVAVGNILHRSGVRSWGSRHRVMGHVSVVMLVRKMRMRCTRVGNERYGR